MIYNTNPALYDSPLLAWDNLIQKGTLTATSSAAGYPLSGLLNGYTTDPWRPDAMPATLTLTMASAVYADTLCFAAHDMATHGVTVILERFVNSAWSQVMTIAPASDDPFIMAFPAMQASQWRIRFTGSNTFRLAVISLSRGLVIPGRVVPPHVPLHRVSEVELIGDSQSSVGEFLQADFLRTGGRASVQFSVQLGEFAAGDSFEGFRQHFNRGYPFFMACFPRAYPKDMGYLWRTGGSIVTPWRDAVFMDIAMECGVYVR